MSAIELKRLRWRCRRGMKELDQLLVDWLEHRWADADAVQRAAFERLLEAEDDSLWQWCMGRAHPADANEHALIDAIRSDRSL